MEKVDVKKLIVKARNQLWPVGIYGLGQLGQKVGMQLLEWIDLRLNFACDQNSAAIDYYVKMHPDIKKMLLSELCSTPLDTFVLICVSDVYIDSVYDVLSRNSNIHAVTIDDICAMDCALEAFYGIENIRSYEKKCISKEYDIHSQPKAAYMKERIAVYTCITGGYDTIREPQYVEDNCDYYLISDIRPPRLSVYKWIPVNDIVPSKTLSNAAKNRWCKMHGHKIFADYKHSLYIDGSIQIISSVSYYKNLVGSVGIALHKHPDRNCIFEEGLFVYASRRGNLTKEAIMLQMKKYLFNGMPRDYGLFACCVIVRDHSNSMGNVIMEQWFDEYMNSLSRDQFSFTYILWKNGISAKEIGILNDGKSYKKNKDFVINEDHGT